MANDAIQIREKMISDIRKAEPILLPTLPKHVNFNEVCQQLLVLLHQNPKLLECTPKSVFWAFVHSIELGLKIGVGSDEAYIIPYKNIAKFVPGYPGLVRLAYQGQTVKLISSTLVCQNDTFELDFGENKVVCKPLISGPRGSAIGVYTRIELTTTGIKHHYMNLDELEQVRVKAPGGSNPESPWNQHRNAMYWKTGLRHALKDIPKGRELSKALQLDIAAELGLPTELEEPAAQLPADTKPKGGRASQAKAALMQKANGLTAPQQAPEPESAPIEEPSYPVQEEIMNVIE